MRDALREQWFSALAADHQAKQVQFPAPPGRWNESSPSGFRLSETCRSLLRWTFDLIMWKSFVWMSFACSRLETLFGSQSVLKRRSLPGKVLVRGCGGTGRSWRYIGQRASSFVVKVLCREGLSLTTAIIYSKKRKPAMIPADLKDEQDWRHWSFRYERNLRRSRWEGAENPFVTACK